MADVVSLVQGVLGGNIRSIAKSISLVENDLPEKEELLKKIYPHAGKAVIFGITGPPGSGKSTLLDRLIKTNRGRGKKVAVAAVDPSSPFSLGAILGDRIRMQSHAADPGVYIRSMASRGHLGGVASATIDTVKILDAAGFDYIFIETIGVGQAEVEVATLSDVVLLVLIPGMGDEIQAMKAGVMEIGDIYVINKKDLDGADRLKAEIEYILNLANGNSCPLHPVKMVSAEKNEGIDELVSTMDEYVDHMKSNGALMERRKENIKKELQTLISSKVRHLLENRFSISECLECWAEDIFNGEIDPYSMIQENITSKLAEKELPS